MKNFLEKSKDILYDSIDYLIMLGIVIVVVSIIAWRLDLLFIDQPGDIVTSTNSLAENKDLLSNQETKLNNVDKNNYFTIEIASGSNTLDVATILESNNLISNKSDFIDVSEEMDLSNKLRAGSFDIPYNSSIESILELLTK